MADGVTMKVRNKDLYLKKLRAIAPNIDEELSKANAKSAQEMVDLAQRLAPKRTGDYARSINAKPIEGGVATFSDTKRTSKGLRTTTSKISATAAWGVFAGWIWPFLEFGTRAAKARPHLFPAYRLIKKRHRNRARRALNKAIKDAMRGGQ